MVVDDLGKTRDWRCRVGPAPFVFERSVIYWPLESKHKEHLLWEFESYFASTPSISSHETADVGSPLCRVGTEGCGRPTG